MGENIGFDEFWAQSNGWISRTWPIKISWCVGTTTHVHNALDSNPKSDHCIWRMWWNIGVGEVWQQLDGQIVRTE